MWQLLNNKLYCRWHVKERVREATLTEFTDFFAYMGNGHVSYQQVTTETSFVKKITTYLTY